MKRLSLAAGLSALAIVVAAGVAAQPARALAQEDGPPPATTQAPLPSVPAPAPVNQALPDFLQYKSPYTGEQSDLSQPNRSASEIMVWAQDKVTDALTLQPATFNNKVAQLRQNFTEKGWNDYGAFMNNNHIVDAIQKSNYGILSIIDGDARIINSDAIAGAYHWLVDMPVIVTYTQHRPDGTTQQVNSTKYHLTIQVGRTADAGAKDGVLLESWDASATP